MDIEKRGEGHADSYSHIQVSKHSKEKSRDPNGNIGFRQAKDRADLPPLSHVVSHHEQNRGKRSQRNKARQRSRNQKYGQQGKGMDDARHRRQSS